MTTQASIPEVRRHPLSAAWLAWRVRARAILSGAHVDLAVEHPAVVARRLRILVGRGARIALRVGRRCRIERGGSFVLTGGTLSIGPDTRVGNHVFIETDGGDVVIADAVRLGVGCVLRAQGGRIEIGSGASLGDLVVAHSSPGRVVRIGPGAAIGPKVVMMPGADVAPGGVVPPNAVLPDAPRP